MFRHADVVCLCLVCIMWLFSMLHDFQFANAGRGCNRRPDNDGKTCGLNQTTYHSYTMRTCQNHSTVLYGRKGTTWTSYLHRQAFRICVRSLFSIQSLPHTTPPNMCQCKPSNCCTTHHIQKTLQPEESGIGRIFSRP